MFTPQKIILILALAGCLSVETAASGCSADGLYNGRGAIPYSADEIAACLALPSVLSRDSLLVLDQRSAKAKSAIAIDGVLAGGEAKLKSLLSNRNAADILVFSDLPYRSPAYRLCQEFGVKLVPSGLRSLFAAGHAVSARTGDPQSDLFDIRSTSIPEAGLGNIHIITSHQIPEGFTARSMTLKEFREFTFLEGVYLFDKEEFPALASDRGFMGTNQNLYYVSDLPGFLHKQKHKQPVISISRRGCG